MKAIAFLLYFLIGSCFGTPATGRVTTVPAPTPDFKVVAIHAYLYFESTGALSRDLLSGPGFALWNTTIGGGDAGTPSSTTMLVAEISCPREEINVPPKRKLVFRVTQGKAVVLNKSLEFPFVAPTGKILMPIFVYGHNMSPLKITATITGQRRASSLTKTIDFRAGE